MITSENISKISIAVSKMQGSLGSAEKNNTNPHFKSSYANLESCWIACREALATNELSVIQSPSFIDNRMVLITRLCHSSGEWFQSELSLKPERGDTPQAIGSCITYAKRYALMAIVGIADTVDDDGNAATQKDKTIRVYFNVKGLIDVHREDHVHFYNSYLEKNEVVDQNIKKSLIGKALAQKVTLIDLDDFIKKTLIEMEHPDD